MDPRLRGDDAVVRRRICVLQACSELNPQPSESSLSLAPSVKENVAPWSGPGESPQTSPSCRRTIRYTVARPTPVPENSRAECRR